MKLTTYVLIVNRLADHNFRNTLWSESKLQ